MKLSPVLAIVLFASVALQARDDSSPSSTTIKRSKTYYSYSYKPTGGSSVHASGFTHGGGFHLNKSASSSAASSSSIANWKNKANSAASNWKSKIQLPTVK